MSGIFENLPKPKKSVFFEILRRGGEDEDPKRANVGIGTYLDGQGYPVVFPTVRKAEEALLTKEGAERFYNLSHPTKFARPVDGMLDKLYTGFLGMSSFCEASAELLFGNNSIGLREKRIMSKQCCSGISGLREIFDFLSQHFPERKIYLPNETFVMHYDIFKVSRKNRNEENMLSSYRYFDRKTYSLDFKGMIEDFSTKIEEGSVVLLHMSGHNPTGMDPTEKQWDEILEVMKKRKLLPFVDNAYQGMVSGDLSKDAYCVRKMDEQRMECLISQSFSKIMGMYGERVGAVHCICKTEEEVRFVRSEFSKLTMTSYGFPPLHGARVATFVLRYMKEEWLEELKFASLRLRKMRKILFELLTNKLKTPGNWNYIVEGKGMFILTHLSPKQCMKLVDEKHVYIVPSGRISVAGMNDGNVENVAKAIDWVIRNHS